LSVYDCNAVMVRSYSAQCQRQSRYCYKVLEPRTVLSVPDSMRGNTGKHYLVFRPRTVVIVLTARMLTHGGIASAPNCRNSDKTVSDTNSVCRSAAGVNATLRPI
jgi:hypothetical protein